MKKIFCTLVVVTTLAGLTGCGLKGPLYFPPADKEQTPTTKSVTKEDAVQSAPSRNDRGTGDGPTQVVY
ncbi:LPS translocon maturation chaperone LptM [Klebsiella sp. BIGb0407]|uniref:LPS translocon maturation chaperone LptM n=1 Tax=Klebsiella sp. BIGb0407 TaxID=2940603 RepID=UPI002169DF38|nr:lipoprotein [Klebsiella sp. BIGb0407]MCS3434400.1 putative small lipoprotein YifL [Klebsiella sp. BIGb0407]